MTQQIDIADLTITKGQATVTVNSNESLKGYKDGDIIFTTGNKPIFVKIITGKIITLRSNASFTANNVTAVLMANNVSLREALTTIQENNKAWSVHFSPFLHWISTNEQTADLIDSSGNVINVYSAQGMNALAVNIGSAVNDAAQLQLNVNTLTSTVSSIQSSLDASKNAARASEDKSKASENAAKTSKDQAATSASAAATSKADAFNSKNSANTDKLAAANSANAAKTSENNTSDKVTLASQYANHPEDEYIPGTTEYSSKHWKQKAKALAGGTAPNSLELGNKTAAQWQQEVDDAGASLPLPLVHLFAPNEIVKTLSGKLTSARLGPATYIDRYGKLIYSPSPVVTNGVPYSEDITDISWEKLGVTVTGNAGTDPFGGINATLITPTGGDSLHCIRAFQLNSVSASTTHSIFVKYAGYSTVAVGIYSGGQSKECKFDFDTGAIDVGSVGGSMSDIVSGGAEYISEGWYRIWLKTNLQRTQIIIAPNYTGTFTGDTDKGVLVFGVAIENGVTVPSGYLKTTGASKSGISYLGIDTLRINEKGALIEGSSTNLFAANSIKSYTFWNKDENNTLFFDDSVQNIDGTMGAIRVTNNDVNTRRIHNSRASPLAYVANTKVTASCVVRSGNGGGLRVRFYGDGGLFKGDKLYNIGTKTPSVSSPNVTLLKVEPLAHGWDRVSFSFESGVNITDLVAEFYTWDIGNITGQTMYIDYMQFENIPFASSIIISGASPETRSADDVSIPWQNNITFDNYTITAEVTLLSKDEVVSGTNGRKYLYNMKGFAIHAAFIDSVGTRFFAYGAEGTTGAASNSAIPNTPNLKVAVVRGASPQQLQVYADGEGSGIDTSFTENVVLPPSTSRFEIGRLSSVRYLWGYIKNFKIFDVALTAAQVKKL